MYNYQFNRHNVGVNKLAHIHFTMWCFPSCQNDRGRFCSFLRGLAAPFPCGSFIDTFAGFSVGGSDFCPMIESIFSHTSASLASAGCAGSSCCLRRALVRSLQRHSTLRATPRQKKSSFPRASVYVALLSSDLTRSAVSLSQPCKKCFVSPMHLPHIWQSRSARGMPCHRPVSISMGRSPSRVIASKCAWNLLSTYAKYGAPGHFVRFVSQAASSSARCWSSATHVSRRVLDRHTICIIEMT